MAFRAHVCMSLSATLRVEIARSHTVVASQRLICLSTTYDKVCTFATLSVCGPEYPLIMAQ